MTMHLLARREARALESANKAMHEAEEPTRCNKLDELIGCLAMLATRRAHLVEEQIRELQGSSQRKDRRQLLSIVCPADCDLSDFPVNLRTPTDREDRLKRRPDSVDTLPREPVDLPVRELVAQRVELSTRDTQLRRNDVQCNQERKPQRLPPVPQLPLQLAGDMLDDQTFGHELQRRRAANPQPKLVLLIHEVPVEPIPRLQINNRHADNRTGASGFVVSAVTSAQTPPRVRARGRSAGWLRVALGLPSVPQTRMDRRLAGLLPDTESGCYPGRTVLG
jgi:hypothetical protein